MDSINLLWHSVNETRTVKAGIEKFRGENIPQGLLYCEGCSKEIAPEQEGVGICKGCNMMHYCGKDCLKNDWANGHKQECEAIRTNASWKLAGSDVLLRHLHRVDALLAAGITSLENVQGAIDGNVHLRQKASETDPDHVSIDEICKIAALNGAKDFEEAGLDAFDTYETLSAEAMALIGARAIASAKPFSKLLVRLCREEIALFVAMRLVIFNQDPKKAKTFEKAVDKAQARLAKTTRDTANMMLYVYGQVAKFFLGENSEWGAIELFEDILKQRSESLRTAAQILMTGQGDERPLVSVLESNAARWGEFFAVVSLSPGDLMAYSKRPLDVVLALKPAIDNLPVLTKAAKNAYACLLDLARSLRTSSDAKAQTKNCLKTAETLGREIDMRANQANFEPVSQRVIGDSVSGSGMTEGVEPIAHYPGMFPNPRKYDPRNVAIWTMEGQDKRWTIAPLGYTDAVIEIEKGVRYEVRIRGGHVKSFLDPKLDPLEFIRDALDGRCFMFKNELGHMCVVPFHAVAYIESNKICLLWPLNAAANPYIIFGVGEYANSILPSFDDFFEYNAYEGDYNMKDLWDMVEAMWDAPGMPGANQVLADFEAEKDIEGQQKIGQPLTDGVEPISHYPGFYPNPSKGYQGETAILDVRSPGSHAVIPYENIEAVGVEKGKDGCEIFFKGGASSDVDASGDEIIRIVRHGLNNNVFLFTSNAEKRFIVPFHAVSMILDDQILLTSKRAILFVPGEREKAIESQMQRFRAFYRYEGRNSMKKFWDSFSMTPSEGISVGKKRSKTIDSQLIGSNWIHGAIKHPGAFTATAHHAGYSGKGGTMAFAHHVQAHPGDYSGLTRKRAALALTLSRMHHHGHGHKK